MGQPIQVKSTVAADIAIFDLDRSLTGQEGWSYTRDSAAGTDGPGRAAAALFKADPEIDHVFVHSNGVTARRPGGWDDGALERGSNALAALYVVYRTVSPEERIQLLREANYNAAITELIELHSDLWILRITPDAEVPSFAAGQYTTLGLGNWEPRVEGSEVDVEEDAFEKMARRSYSVSSSILDEGDGLIEETPGWVEFYVVLVRGEQPALTPRLFTRKIGDRIFLGSKYTGHYTLSAVSPQDNVVFLATGTGEAPHNLMTLDLLRRGHQGRILSVTCGRYRQDLGYAPIQERVVERFDNYRYLGVTTREPENKGQKQYIQDLLESGRIDEELGVPLDPADTHVFLCGNPLMIGLPTFDDDGTPSFPEPRGACEVLVERGFTIDRRKSPGNVHYEEYWTER